MTRAEVTQLANEALVERLARCVVVGATSKGRTKFVLVGDETPAEARWEALKVPHLRVERGL